MDDSIDVTRSDNYDFYLPKESILAFLHLVRSSLGSVKAARTINIKLDSTLLFLLAL